MKDITTALSSLSNKKPFFHSQKDFQEALMHELRGLGYECTSNKNVSENKKIDIWAENLKEDITVAIEIRNKTRKLSNDLKDHGAQDQGRYDLLSDIEKLEKIVSQEETLRGSAILITNDPYYWELPKKLDSVDRDFHIFEGAIITGELMWDPLASQGTMNNRQKSIVIKDTYKMTWNNFSSIPNERYGLFRYLMVQV